MAMINAVLEYISQLALDVISASGYFGIFILSFLESAAIPIPSEVVVPFSGFLASRGEFSLWGVILVATGANLAGSLFLYWIGKSGARWVLEKYGRYVLISPHHLETGDRWFHRYGVRAVFWGRMLPVVRTFISLPAGVARMGLVQFISWTFLGALPWNAGLAYAGFKAGERWHTIHDSLHWVSYGVVVVLALAVVYYLWQHIRSSRIHA